MTVDYLLRKQQLARMAMSWLWKINDLEFSEPDPEVFDEITELSKYLILWFSVSANFYFLKLRVLILMPLMFFPLFSITQGTKHLEFSSTLRQVKVRHLIVLRTRGGEVN